MKQGTQMETEQAARKRAETSVETCAFLGWLFGKSFDSIFSSILTEDGVRRFSSVSIWLIWRSGVVYR